MMAFLGWGGFLAHVFYGLLLLAAGFAVGMAKGKAALEALDHEWFLAWQEVRKELAELKHGVQGVAGVKTG